ncbi:MAG TPA: hypothetical protein VG838_17775 [Opitutaceae bacterium]|nr:hypothetical protein [Opitutaceae bacterium]
MTIRLRRFLPLAGLFALFPSLALAHPGHGGHEVTWDFRHLAAHPLATLGCFAVLAAGAWCALQLAKWGGLVPQEIRSDDSAAKRSED